MNGTQFLQHCKDQLRRTVITVLFPFDVFPIKHWDIAVCGHSWHQSLFFVSVTSRILHVLISFVSDWWEPDLCHSLTKYIWNDEWCYVFQWHFNRPHETKYCKCDVNFRTIRTQCWGTYSIPVYISLYVCVAQVSKLNWVIFVHSVNLNSGF